MNDQHIPKRLVRIARDVSLLPPELHEPILAKLSFVDIVRLSRASTASAVLIESIRTSPEWRWLFESRLESIKSSWEALDEISSLWRHAAFTEVWKMRHGAGDHGYWEQHSHGLRSVAVGSSYDKRFSDNSPESIATRIESGMRDMVPDLFGVFLDFEWTGAGPGTGKWWENAGPWGLWCYGGRQGLKAGDRRALSLFLPKDVRNALLCDDEIPTTLDQNQSWEQCMQDPPTEEILDLCAHKLERREWSYEAVISVLPIFRHALSLLKMAQAAENNAIVALYDRFPNLLKTPMAPNSHRKNRAHIRNLFALDTTRPRMRRTRPLGKLPSESGKPCVAMWRDYRFRGPNMALIPYNWCIRLFDTVGKRYPISENGMDSIYPVEIHSQLQTALASFEYIHGHGDTTNTARRPRLGRTIPEESPYYLMHYGIVYGCPKPLQELAWLEAFTESVAWMQTRFPDECQRAKSASYTLGPAIPFSLSGDSIMGAMEYKRFIRTAPAQDIARQLQLDSQICDDVDGQYSNSSPSLLALHLSPKPSPLSRAIGAHLLLSEHPAGPEVRQLLYENTLTKIIKHIRGTGGPSSVGDDGSAAQFAARATKTSRQEEAKKRTERALQDSIRIAQDIKASSSDEHEITAASDAMAALMKLVTLKEASTSKSVEDEEMTHHQIQADYQASLSQETMKTQPRAQTWKKPCYICRFIIETPHGVFPSMCVPCGDFNVAGSNFTKKTSLAFSSKTRVAVITGGRVNLGFHTARRLLRQRVRVIVTTRYPEDAALRFAEALKEDKHLWSCNDLAIIGADFRTAADVFGATKEIKRMIERWSGWQAEDCGVYLLVNNAAQTLTDSIAKENTAIEREKLLAGDEPRFIMPKASGYTPRVRGGIRDQLDGTMPASMITDGQSTSTGTNTDIFATSVDQGPSSWVQSLSEIPYEDVISAHSVNTFAPLILIRELTPLMKNNGGAKLQGHIVNVSSREGIFEKHRGTKAKHGKHVHTNMSKAGLNMITETEAEMLWKEKGIAMNTVDPGYMSAAPECEDSFDGERPIGWEDGAGRVLWPVRCMELEYKKSIDKTTGGKNDMNQYWGRFFKHYGAVRVEPRFGRG
ncbi:hypothetical protein VHEMI04251 [[Torrubiella] hemipterigena]|uniref:F-box domain-containing protein n=1 Tax=[Torrubiella] hemipterigena TaxID=1531966 RepID=A0A0A1TDA2_9HYPO|nr:hypothetical protein VHEMI04251 [[Torrubiella] hemipterigena]